MAAEGWMRKEGNWGEMIVNKNSKQNGIFLKSDICYAFVRQFHFHSVLLL